MFPVPGSKPTPSGYLIHFPVRLAAIVAPERTYTVLRWMSVTQTWLVAGSNAASSGCAWDGRDTVAETVHPWRIVIECERVLGTYVSCETGSYASNSGPVPTDGVHAAVVGGAGAAPPAGRAITTGS